MVVLKSKSAIKEHPEVEFRVTVEEYLGTPAEGRMLAMKMLHQIAYASMKGDIGTLQKMYAIIENETFKRGSDSLEKIRNYEDAISGIIYLLQENQ